MEGYCLCYSSYDDRICPRYTKCVGCFQDGVRGATGDRVVVFIALKGSKELAR